MHKFFITALLLTAFVQPAHAQCSNVFGPHECPTIVPVAAEGKIPINKKPFKWIRKMDLADHPRVFYSPGISVDHTGNKQNCSMVTNVKTHYKHQIVSVPLKQIEYYVHEDNRLPGSGKLFLIAKCKDDDSCIKDENRSEKRSMFLKETQMLNFPEPADNVFSLVASLRGWVNQYCAE